MKWERSKDERKEWTTKVDEFPANKEENINNNRSMPGKYRQEEERKLEMKPSSQEINFADSSREPLSLALQRSLSDELIAGEAICSLMVADVAESRRIIAAEVVRKLIDKVEILESLQSTSSQQV